MQRGAVLQAAHRGPQRGLDRAALRARRGCRASRGGRRGSANCRHAALPGARTEHAAALGAHEGEVALLRRRPRPSGRWPARRREATCRGRARRSRPRRAQPAATASTATWAIALVGMPGYSASSGSCTTATPPWALMTARPAVPSSAGPDSTTPTTSGPCASRGRPEQRVDRGPVAVLPRADRHAGDAVLHDEVMVGRRDEDVARAQRLAVGRCAARQIAALPRIPARALVLVGAMCSTTQIGAPGGRRAGRAATALERLDPARRRADHDEISRSVLPVGDRLAVHDLQTTLTQSG